MCFEERILNFCSFFQDFIYLFLERVEGRERGRETSICGCLYTPPAGDVAHNPGMCPEWELNQQLFGLQASTQSTEPHQLEPNNIHFRKLFM